MTPKNETPALIVSLLLTVGLLGGGGWWLMRQLNIGRLPQSQVVSETPST